MIGTDSADSEAQAGLRVTGTGGGWLGAWARERLSLGLTRRLAAMIDSGWAHGRAHRDSTDTVAARPLITGTDSDDTGAAADS